MGIYKPNTAKNWWARIQFKGERRFIDLGITWLGKASDRKLAESAYHRERDKFMEAVDSGIDLNPRLSIKALRDEYMEKHGSLKKSAASDTLILRDFLAYFGEDTPAKKITTAALERFRADGLKEVSKARMNRRIATIKGMFSKAVEWGRIGDNPFKRIKMYREEGIPERFLSEAEKEALYKAAPEWIVPILKTALLTGMRKGELIALKWADVNWSLRQITVQAANAKSGKGRKIPMTVELAEILRRQPKIVSWVFTDPDGAGQQLKPYGALRTTFDKVVEKMERAGFAHFRFHDLRHTFASDLAIKGADLMRIQKLMGHSTIGMTMRYAHLSPGHLRETIDLLERPAAREYTENVPTAIEGISSKTVENQ